MKRWLSPYNDISLQLASHVAYEGFIDSYKVGQNVYTLEKACNQIDEVVICSPNHFKDIYFNLIKAGVSKNNIVFYVQNRLIKSIYIANFLYRTGFFALIDSWKIRYFYLKDFFISYKSSMFDDVRNYFFKDKYQGMRAIIIGNGRSLTVSDLDRLQNEITFGANKLFLAYEQTDFRPTYYFVSDELVLEQSFEQLNNLEDSIKLFPRSLLRKHKRAKGTNYYNLCSDYRGFPKVSSNPALCVYGGNTIVYVMIQWAIFMGFKEVYLIGVDFCYEIPPYLKSCNNILYSEDEKNHFHENYRKPGEKWYEPHLEKQYVAFEYLSQYAQKSGVEIFNASRFSKLDIFRKIDLETIFKQSN